jgi:hypothetical protein
MVVSNCLFPITSENPLGFSIWHVLANFIKNERKYSLKKPSAKN